MPQSRQYPGSLALRDQAGSIVKKKPGFGTTGTAKVRVGVLTQLDYFQFADIHSESVNPALTGS
jgi:hypothetical protein